MVVFPEVVYGVVPLSQSGHVPQSGVVPRPGVVPQVGVVPQRVQHLGCLNSDY